MPTTLRLLLLLMLGLFGLQPVSYSYDAPAAFVSGAQNIVAASPDAESATAETAALVPLNFNRDGAASEGRAETRPISNFVAAASGMVGLSELTEAVTSVANVFIPGEGEVAEAAESGAAGDQAFNLTFQTEHALPHFEGTGMSQANIETQIGIELQTQLSTLPTPTVQGPFMGRINFQGTTIEYRGFGGLPNNTINIGTYYPVGP
jgi:hypothetical protein